MPARLRPQLEGAIQVVIAALVVWMGLAVGNVRPLNLPIGRAVRWAILAELCVLALAYAALRLGEARGQPRSLPRAVVLLATLLAGLALLSALWSASPGVTVGRGLTLAVLFVTAGALAYGAAGRVPAVGQLLLGVLAGAGILGVGGLITLALDPDRALVPATTGTPTLYNGLGSNPNALALLFAMSLPLAVWAFVEAQSAAGKGVAASLLVLLGGSLVASGARGGLLGAFAGVAAFLLVLPLGRRQRVAFLATALALLFAGVAVGELLPRAETNPVLNPEFGAEVPINDRDAQFIRPLQNEIALSGLARRFEEGVLGTSGRLQAWSGALGQAWQRPLLGHGFGTEERVFVDRYYPFLGGRPENSYIGTVLQLGVVGFALLAGLLGAVLATGVRALGRLVGDERRARAVCLALVVCGLVLALTQSYLTAVGSPPTFPFWLAAFVLVAVPQRINDRHEGERNG